MAYSAKVQRLLQELNNRIPGFVKLADELESEKTFEDMFANLCFAIQQETDPQLMKYVLGFQLLEKSDDERRAVGVIGMEINGRIVLAPFFFIDGEIFGNDLLWVADANMFVPKTPEWVSYIASTKESVLGEQLPKEFRPKLQPILRFLKPYFAKTASWIQPYLPDIADMVVNPPDLPILDPERLLQHKQAAAAMLRIAACHPRLKLNPRICELCKKAESRLNESVLDLKPVLNPDSKLSPPGQVEVYWNVLLDDPDFSTEEKLAFKKKGYVIRDRRTRFTKAASERELRTVVRGFYRSPGKNGVYTTRIDNSGELYECLILLRPGGVERAHSPSEALRTAAPTAYILPLEGPHKGQWFKASQNRVITSEGPRTKEEFVAALKEIGEKINDDADLRQDDFIIVTTSGDVVWDCGWPKRMLRSEGGDHSLSEVSARTTHHFPGLGDFGGPRPIRVEKMLTAEPLVTEEVVIIPAGESYLIPRKPAKDLPPSATNPFKLVEPRDKDIIRLKVVSRGGSAVIDGQEMPKKAAMPYLVVVYGLREKDAEEILRRADREHYWLLDKSAAEIPLAGRLAAAPTPPDVPLTPDSISSYGVPSTTDVRTTELVPGLKELSPPLKTPPYPPVNPKTVEHINKALESGQSEILDASVFGAILAETNDQALIDKYIPGLMRAMDSVARMLFALYWHKDRFIKRFGEYDVERLRTMLTTCFKQLGDLIQILQEQKTVNLGGLPESIGEFEGALKP